MERADRIINLYKAKKAEYRDRHPASKEAVAHAQLLAEVPNLGEKIARAASEFNDRASEAGLRVSVEADNAPHFALAIFKVRASGLFEPAFELSLTVDHDGNVIGFITGQGNTDRLIREPILTLTSAQIFDMIIDVVEIEVDSQPL
jgi:hypothetical protein